MRYIGIDFGSKRVGIALSDEEGRVAFPHMVADAGGGLIGFIKKLCEENEVGGIVIGESKNFQGEDNAIMKGILAFKEELERELAIPVLLEPEFLTSTQADRQLRPMKPDARMRQGPEIRKKDSLLDASAAALILQSYLDKRQSYESNANFDTDKRE